MVQGINFRGQTIDVITDFVFKLFRRDKFVFSCGDGRLECFRLVFLRINVEFFTAGFNNGKLIPGIQNCKVRGEANSINVFAQHTHTHGVKRGYPNVTSTSTHQLTYTLLHFTGCFVRKSEGQNVPRRRFTRANDVSNPVREHTRLAASRSSHN
ncbi:hypothetical protein D3C85_1203940 [compost metagenome]